jgi:hypothetical protein
VIDYRYLEIVLKLSLLPLGNGYLDLRRTGCTSIGPIDSSVGRYKYILVQLHENLIDVSSSLFVADGSLYVHGLSFVANIL